MRKLFLIILITISLQSFGQTPMFKLIAKKTTCADSDANAFISAAGITNATEKSAICTLVKQLKDSSLWTKFYAIYPMVGGTSSSTSYNLKNTAAYQITWTGSPSFSSNGVDFNGSSQYGNTGLVPNGLLSTTSTSLSYYSRDNVASGIDMGCYNAGTDVLRLGIKYSDNNSYTETYGAGASIGLNIVSNTTGFFVTSRTDNTDYRFYQNASLLATKTEGASGSSTVAMYIGAENFNGAASNYGQRQCAFASISDGLTSGEITTFNTIIQAFQTTLGR